jgi:hypothetical protein
MVSHFCKCRRENPDGAPEKDGKIKEGLNTFLASSFNVELVYIILKGIQKFTKERKRIEDGRSSQQYFHEDDMTAGSGSMRLSSREKELNNIGVVIDEIKIESIVKVDVHAPLYFTSI